MKFTSTLGLGSVDDECPSIELASLLACCLSLQGALVAPHPVVQVHGWPFPGGQGILGC